MAQVDFSNASFDFGTDFALGDRMGLTSYLCDSSGRIIGNHTATTTAAADSYTCKITEGRFTSSGTEAYICNSAGTRKFWRIYNISFSYGDTYEFTVKANLTC